MCACSLQLAVLCQPHYDRGGQDQYIESQQGPEPCALVRASSQVKREQGEHDQEYDQQIRVPVS